MDQIRGERMPAPTGIATVKKVSLALQGGGAHGAFTWGVLDRLLEDGRLLFDGISGISAGAMNAAVLAQGWLEGGPEGARRKLEQFWRRISEKQLFSPWQATPFERAIYGYDLSWSMGYQFFETVTRLFSPYQFNPLDINPLRELLDEMIDAERLRTRAVQHLFIGATNIHTGEGRVFRGHELSAEVLMASACLPFLFRAVELEGEHYWDGGYAGNPPIWPLYEQCEAADIVLVELNPAERRSLPITVPDILNRLTEITFNTALLAELRAIEFVQRLVEEGRVPKDRYRNLRLHVIEDTDRMRGLSVSSKFNADWGFLRELFAHGREAADGFLIRHFDQVGVESSVDLRARYL
jgi:NTE family protein